MGLRAKLDTSICMKTCIKAIQDYACSGRGGRGKQYRSFFADEEAFCIKAFMEYFYKLTHVADIFLMGSPSPKD